MAKETYHFKEPTNRRHPICIHLCIYKYTHKILSLSLFQTRTHAHTHAHIHTHIHTGTQAHLHTTHTNTCKLIHIHMDTHTHKNTCKHTHTHPHTRSHTRTHARKCTRIHTNTKRMYTNKHTCVLLVALRHSLRRTDWLAVQRVQRLPSCCGRVHAPWSMSVGTRERARAPYPSRCALHRLGPCCTWR